jgi:hypothetical protein
MGELPVIGPYTNAIGWLAIIALIIVSWVKGWLWPSNQVDVVIKYYEAALKDKDNQIARWETAYNNADARADIFAQGQTKLVDSVATNNALIQTLIANRSSQKETIT